MLITKKFINCIDILLYNTLILFFIWIYILNNWIFFKCVKFNNFYTNNLVGVKITII